MAIEKTELYELNRMIKEIEEKCGRLHIFCDEDGCSSFVLIDELCYSTTHPYMYGVIELLYNKIFNPNQSEEIVQNEQEKPKINLNDLIGKPEKDAAKLAIDFGSRCRIVKRNGIPKIITRDLVKNRVNLYIVDGIVTMAYFG